MVRVALATMFTIAAACVVMAMGVGALAKAAAELSPALVDPYLRVQTALAADKVDTVKADAAAIAKAAEALGEPAKPIAGAAKKLEEAKDLRTARVAFGQLSDAVFAYAKATGASMPSGVKTAYCPMANKSWLQKGDKIQNPYYGSEMLECGSFTK
jgi:hypothetical protein